MICVKCARRDRLRYKDTADKNLIQVQAGTEGYPPDLQTLVAGVQLTGAKDQRIHFLRQIPVDPLTVSVKQDWGKAIRARRDPDSTSWGGDDVFDGVLPVHSDSA